MDNKRKLSDSEVERYANMDDSDWEDFEDTDSDIYEPSGDSSEDLSESEAIPEREDNQIVQTSSESNLNVWNEIPQNPPQFIFEKVPGLTISDSTDITIEKLVNLFFSEEFLCLLVQQTNLYAAQEIDKHGPVRRSSRLSKWKETDISEMKVFWGLLLHMGPCSLPSIEHYWSKSIFYNPTFWRSIMSRNRFQLLLRFLHFADNSIQSADRLYKVRSVLKHFNSVMRNNYVPDKNLCIDESMVLWRGRLFFRQYIKNKKNKYGVKLYELCESNGLVLKIKIYCGKSEKCEQNMGHASEVVLHLIEGYLDKGYILYMDNFYNSVALTKLLSGRKTYVCGTLRANRKENPKDIVGRKLKKGEVVWRQNGSVVVCKWKDKREVLTISNMHTVEMVEVPNRNGKLTIKPNIVRDYNKGMSGIDRSDQMLSYYSALRKTIRWPKKIVLHIVELYIHNAYILYRQITGSNIISLKFREKFIECLIGQNMPSVTKKNKSEESTFHYLECIPPTEKKTRPTKPCRVCTQNKMRRETRYYCPVCDEKPALCVQDCFKTYHQ